ncbi:MAG: hypothetical protein R2712_32100, partial [Vicinamibacterales bacterium]
TGGAVNGTVTLWPHRVDVTGRAWGGSAELRGQMPWGPGVAAEMAVRVQRSPTGRLTGEVELQVGDGQTRSYSLLSVVP